jgi:RNA polymerase sigma factor (sigma-70 family)
VRDCRLNEALLDYRARAAARAMRGLTDAELLGRFVAARDEAAFAALMGRHGGMVLGVCRRVLRHEHDAEDACQATFLALARQAGSIRKRASLPSWLHGVAHRLSLRLRADANRRTCHGPDAARPAQADAATAAAWQEAMQALDEELGRLPAHYRAPLVLCYLEGKTQDEAARQLGWTPGAFRGRGHGPGGIDRPHGADSAHALPVVLPGLAAAGDFRHPGRPPGPG